MNFAEISLVFALAATPRYDAFEKTIPELQEAMERGEVTSRELVRQYLERIEAFDRGGPALNSLIYVNSRALEEADALVRERRGGGAGGSGPAPRDSHRPQGQLRHEGYAHHGELRRPHGLRSQRRRLPGPEAPRGGGSVPREGEPPRARPRVEQPPHP